ncbi:MAG: multicopper oxidase domain-containing protein [Nitrososphaera sp.]|nr:multicopper oxidase domain-containing protein [Nitrososphaera sp.]
MNKAIVAGLAAGVLIVGLVLSPVFTGFPLLSIAEADHEPSEINKHFTLVADEAEVQVTPASHALWPGLKYNAMVFNGTVPGPVISVHQGDVVEITLVNEGDVIHSLDFHSAITTAGANSGPVQSGESKSWTFQAVNAGAFFYHCSADGLNGVWEHIANGMYGGIVVHPHNEKPAKEFYVGFNQIYTTNTANSTTAGSFDFNKFMAKNPDLILTNGMAHKYVPAIGGVSVIPLNSDADVFMVTPGEQTRWYIVNAGPNDGLAFHFIGAMMDVRDGSIKNRYGTQDKNDETWWIPPGSASVIEAVFPEAGLYVGVDHEMTDVVKGGAFAVLATDDATADDHPEGTMVMSMEDSMMEESMMEN